MPTLGMRSVVSMTQTILPHLYLIDEGDVADLFQAGRQDARETLARGVHGEDTGNFQCESSDRSRSLVYA